MPALSTRALNRALLARQLLLARSPMGLLDAVEHLVGLQAQAPTPPYFGLWTRLARFRADDLSDAITARAVVRVALMRSTIHLVTARDLLRLRPAAQPALERGLHGAYRKALDGLDLDAVVEAARAAMEERPLTFGEIGEALRARWPDVDPRALAHAARTRIPLVQVPPRGLWRTSGQPAHRSAESWLGRPLGDALPVDELLLRYLAAFGPASARDAQRWSGLTGLAAAMERLRPRLRVFHDERGRELFDLPDAPRPDPDAPAPPRFLPEFDNLLLAHDDRTRIVADRYRPLVYQGGMIVSTVLVDGFVHGAWRLERGRRAAAAAVLHVSLFAPLPRAARAPLLEEGERLLDFAAPESARREVRLTRVAS